jgi:RNA polymerase sigma factor (sigma-70 family)
LKYLFPTAVESIKIYAANLRKKRKLKELQHPAKLERRRHLYASHKTGLPNLRRNDQLSMLRLWRWNVEQAVKQLEADPDFGPVKNWSNLTEARKQVLRLKVAPIMEFVLRVEALLAGKSQSKTLQPAVHLSRASDDEPAEDNTGKLKEMLEVLDEREAAIIRGRYGMDDGTIKTLSELGRKFGITRERVRQLAKKAMQELRAAKL